MTGVPGTIGRAPVIPRAPRRLKTERERWRAGTHVPALVLRATGFLALAVFAALHWAALVAPAASGRALLACAVVTAGGILISMSARMPRGPGTAVRVGIVVVVAISALTAIGIPLKLLLPKSGWETLGDRVSGGLSGVGIVTEWPYAGPNVWLRLTTLMAAPIVLTVSAAIAFWPRREGTDLAKPARFAALALLVALYGVAVAARPFDADALRGVGLLACLAVWLWLPRLRGREALAALLAIAIAGAIGFGLTAKVASSEPWVHYRHWSWTLRKERTIAFDWRHSYGPLSWPRKGRTLLLIKADAPQYWRAETLDRFDGRGWTAGAFSSVDPTTASGVVAAHPKWVESVKVTVRGLRSELVIGPGSLLAVDDGPGEVMVRSNATHLIDGRLGSGDTYTARGYTPDPTSKQMRAAPVPDPFFTRYTTINLPTDAGFVSSQTSMPLRGASYTGDPDAAAALEASRYGRIYDLAKRITAGATTNYDAVKKVGAYLERSYRYTERVPERRYPLDAFLFTDKKGYCQHFSGAAALMLRMLGIPTRVATGFAPGTLDNDTKEYVVRDLDAHSWIEVWFPTIGWVPFDPTPAAAPASSQAASFTPLSEIASAARGDRKDELDPKLRETFVDGGAGGDVAAPAEAGTPWAWIAAAIVVLMALLAAIVTFIRRSRERRRALPRPCGDADVDHLITLLGRLGLELEPGTTLYELEQRLQRLGGPDAAAYTERLRRRRFGDCDDPAPSRSERRHLRQVLAAAVGAGPLMRLHLALPDGQNARSGGLKLRAVQRPR